MPITPGSPMGGQVQPSANQLPMFQTNNVNPQTLYGNTSGAAPGSNAQSSIYDLLSNAPQSLTASILPYIQQLFQNQSNSGVASAQSDAQARGLTGSSIEAANMSSARSQSNTGLIQSIIPILMQSGQFDIGNTQGYYSNLAGAVGGYNTQQIQQQEFQQQLQAMMDQARMTSSATETAGLYGMAGSLGGAAIGAGAMAFSDIRLKEDLKPIGIHKGHQFYSFRYRQDTRFRLPTGPQVGVLGHEVARTRPDCVSVREGHFIVDYGRLLGVKAKVKASA